MGINVAIPPPEAYKLVEEGVARCRSSQGLTGKAIAKVNQSKLSAALAHRVYTLSARDIVNGLGRNQARLSGWRFIVVEDRVGDAPSKPIGAIELSCDSRGGNLEFASLDLGPFTLATWNKVKQLEGRADVQNGDFELRVLRAQSVYLMAIWLKSMGDGGGPDIIEPLGPPPVPAGGLGGSPSPDSLLSNLIPAAQDALAFYSGPSGGAPTGQEPSGGACGGASIAPPPSGSAFPTYPSWPLGMDPSGGGEPIGGADTMLPMPTINRFQLIKNYASMVARTWVDESYRQLVLSDTASQLATAGMPTVPGAQIVVVESKVTGVGRVEDMVDEWLKGNQTGRYLLWLPIKPDDVDLSGEFGELGGGDNCCCCTPCCSCT